MKKPLKPAFRISHTFAKPLETVGWRRTWRTGTVSAHGMADCVHTFT